MGKAEDKLKEMKERRLTRRRAIVENKEGRDYTEYLQNQQKASSLRYAQDKKDQKTIDNIERPQSKITDNFEVEEE